MGKKGLEKFQVSRRGLLQGLLGFSLYCWFPPAITHSGGVLREETMNLPQPEMDGPVSVEQAIKRRRTTRSFASAPLRLGELSQLLWAAQGITEPGGYQRAAPSAGALYPMEVYAVVGEDCVEGLEAGVYHYRPEDHAVSLVKRGDQRSGVARSALSQMWMAQGPVNLAVTAEYSRITGKYGKRGVRYAMIEAGHIGQNIFLQAEALGLKAGIVGAFRDSDLIQVLGIPMDHEPLVVMPVGRQR